ncbi:MAG: T9SS type A sorting domain-containing protein [Parabacteroides sp.]|nr:T9SS type A sorting domain-containing protein [Parabacteroides sp.]
MKQKYNNILKTIRLLVLVVLMAIGAGLKGWGQTIYKHGTTNNEPFVPQMDIPTRVDTLYIENEETRTLTIPDFKGITGDEYVSGYRWYMHWYRAKKTENGYELLDAGDILTIKADSPYNTGRSCVLVETENNSLKSYFWHTGILGNPQDASYINFKAKGNEEDIVICDISHNLDVDGTSTPGENGILRIKNGILSFAGSKGDFVEPTIARRFMFIIKNPDNAIDGIRTRLNAIVGSDTPLETFNITVPEGASGVNLQMNMTPENYYGDNFQGNSFQYYINRNYEGSSSSRIISLANHKFSDGDIVDVYVNNIKSIIARFKIEVQEKAGFMKDGDDLKQNEQRNPSKNQDKYEEIASYDFDFDEVQQDLSVVNNVRLEPMPSDECSYAFINPRLPSVMARLNPRQNIYGLYRSANVNKISNNNELSVSDEWGKGYSQPNPKAFDKNYDWYFSQNNNVSIYDRTHVNDNTKYGYFLYLDATEDADRVANVKLNGSLCDGTELIVITWVANLSNSGKTLPNLNLIFRGYKKDDNEGEVIHRFTTGDLSSKAAADIGVWYQLYYKIRLPRGANSSYVRYALEVQNNTKDSNGADYAIDDIRIYKSLPNIEVQRENTCDASTLIVSTDYETILRNMGWEEGQDVASEEQFDYNNLQLRKYRYGLMGKNHEYLNSVVGNVYFAFLTEDKSGWVIVNKNAVDVSDVAARAIRIPVSTVQKTDGGYEFYTNDREQAMLNEKLMNLRAVEDYNKDINKWQKDEGQTHVEISIKDIGTPGEPDFNEDKYQEAIKTLYNRLNIPRLRCPWYNEAEGNKGRLYLAVVDVNDTDLKYQGEQYKKEDGTYATANGNYHVLSFSAADVAGFGGATGVTPPGGVDPDSECALISPFTVYPATTITVTTEADASTALCLGALRKIKPILNAYDKETMEPIENFGNYVFDWYLGTLDEYNDQLIGGKSIKYVLNVYRLATGDHNEITFEDIEKWGTGTVDQKNRLKELIESGILRTGISGGETFSTIINSKEIVAIPYVWNENKDYDYCNDVTKVTFDVSDSEIPDFIVGIPGVAYLTDKPVPLRLGRRHLNKQSLTIPIRKTFRMAEGVDHFASDAKNKNVYLKLNDADPIPVGIIANGFTIQRPTSGSDVDAVMTISWNNQALENMKEGQSYDILVPFVQVDQNDVVLESECDGLASFPVKVVPEYLTWKGTQGTKVWYDDDNWCQSTEDELYMGNKTPSQDVNGDDVVTNAFAPLYFTNITIPDNTELKLTSEDKALWGDIQYDMAVDKGADGSIKVVPYYINKVEQIYFKPGATLLNQHLLTYDKARVDFEMTKGDPYWMSSPLKDVYAGDMYAPVGTGRQETPAFDDIYYNHKTDGGNYDRWDPAFYQKAWDKGVTYYTNQEGGISKTVSAVQSNWSIEYNDVNVPYTLGKGFYARVEGSFTGDENNKDALVRLPKADDSYSYYTKAAEFSSIKNRIYAGKMADDEVTITLSDYDDADVNPNPDGDGNHFLIGNPYMAYLNMFGSGDKKGFLTENSTSLAPKYWVLNDGTVSVGTPDVEWNGEQTSGCIAPMQAFFVERAENAANTDLTVTFSIDMTVSKPTSTEGGATTRSFKATNPQLTILAKGAEGKSVSFVVQSDFAENVYKSDEDAVALLDSELKIPMVYTVAGNCAAAVNKVKDMQNIPLGVYAEEDEEVEVTIEGMSQFVDSLYLHDALTGKSVLLDGDTYTLRVNGENHGRYTITTKGGITVESNICVYSPSSNNLMIAASPSETLEQVRVFDMSGRMVENRVDLGSSNCRLRVASGIYIVYAKTEAGETKVKVRVK